MSYQISVYFNDSDIYSTRIYGVNGNVNLTKYYGDTAYIASGFSGTTKFTATPADGCVFTRWVYRIGGDSGEQQYSYENPFSYNGTEDIIIRAEGEVGDPGGGGDDTEPTWEYERKLGYVISDYYEESVYVPPYTTLIYELTFEIESAVKFYTSGDFATKGYLSNSLRFDETTGIPPYMYGVINHDDEGYDNFYFAHIMHTDRTYYLYVQNWDGENASWFTLHIEPYEDGEDTEWNWSDAAYNAFLNNGDTRDVPYTEWNEFVEFVANKTGYYLDSALMPYYDTYLYANQFNEVRSAIGSINTFKNGTNSIKDHYNDTGSWDMSSGEIVKGQYFIDLTKYLNAI